MAYLKNAVAICALSAAIIGASPSGTAPDPKSAESLSDLQIRRKIGYRFGACAVRLAPSLARGAILNTSSASQFFKVIDGRVETWDCIPPRVRAVQLPGDFMRYVIADALVRLDYPEPQQFDFSQRPPLAHSLDVYRLPMSPKKEGSGSDAPPRLSPQTWVALSVFGECVVRAAPGKVHALLLTEVSSPDEKAAFEGLSGHLNACLNDGEIRLTYELLRGSLAVGFYRLAGAPAGASVSSRRGGA